ncbi:MAG: hypothetical protein K2W82_13250 [Candidatus Obscuribacterales bacterium]|nr:hypothetical protein [Candidatus Obscuribacterales bacterium]
MMKHLHVFTHTHWDREWYQPFETYRTYLLAVVKQIVADLENGSLSKFCLDGQAAILDDVFALAPELASRMEDLMRKGKLAAGPWYVLADQMLVCGESLIRNLCLGIETVKKIGEPDLSGYCPDTFGHSQDLPRILSGAGIESAFVWRGVPALKNGSSFYWQSPDGSKVLAYLLARGYYQTVIHEYMLVDNLDKQAKLSAVADHLAAVLTTEAELSDGTASLYDPIIEAALYPLGGDHVASLPELNSILKDVRTEFERRQLAISIDTTHLSEFANLVKDKLEKSSIKLPLIVGELRDASAAKKHCAAYLLPGVLSSRLYLKAANRRLEQLLFRHYEPFFSSLHIRGLMDYPHAELGHVLKLLIQNQPHDSICGCSVDAVHQEMITRYAQAEQILVALKEKALGTYVNRNISWLYNDPRRKLKNVVIANSCSQARSGPVPISFYVEPGEKLKLDSEFFQLEDRRLRDELFASWGSVPYYRDVELVRGWLWAEAVPAYGELRLPLFSAIKKSNLPAVKAGKNRLDNGLLTVKVDDRGRLSVLADSTLYELNHRFVDCADGGDTYNFDPLPGDRSLKTKFVSARAGKKGPLISSLILTYEILIPAELVEAKPGKNGIVPLARSAKKIKHIIETEITLKRGSSILFFESSWENKASGHRLEVLLDSGQKIHTTYSENHFSLVKRLHQVDKNTAPLPVERYNEAQYDRYPTQRFVMANGQVFLNGGLPEYGVSEKSISMTVLRSVSILSRGRMRTRGGGAGPHLAVPEAASLGENRVAYGWAPLAVLGEDIRQAYAYAEEFESEMQAVLSDLESLPDQSTLLRCDNPDILIQGFYISDQSDSLIVRVFNPTDLPQKGRIHFDFDFHTLHFCNFLEEEQEPFLYREFVGDDSASSSVDLELGRNQLATLRLRLKAKNLESKPKQKRVFRRKTARSS